MCRKSILHISFMCHNKNPETKNRFTHLELIPLLSWWSLDEQISFPYGVHKWCLFVMLLLQDIKRYRAPTSEKVSGFFLFSSEHDWDQRTHFHSLLYPYSFEMRRLWTLCSDRRCSIDASPHHRFFCCLFYHTYIWTCSAPWSLHLTEEESVHANVCMHA